MDQELLNWSRGVQQQRSLMVVACRDTSHINILAEALRRKAGLYGSSFAFWSEVSCPHVL